MGKENKKSPLEQSTDKRYNRPTYTGMGETIQDRLIKGAYMSARADAPDYSWMNVIGAGVKTFKEEVDSIKATKQAKRESDLAEIKGITDKIYATGGSLPESYYDQAYDYTELLREKYVAAVESGNNKEATKIKGQLNMFATSIGTVKENITETAEMWNDDMLAGGMTEEQISINKSIGENNAVMNMEDGTFSWRNVDYVEGGKGYLGKEFFTSEDLKEALPLRDDVNISTHLETNKSILENKDSYQKGEGKGFDEKTRRDANVKLIDKSIKDVGSMQSFIWDDITGFGSFADTIEDHPEFQNIFNVINNKDGLKNNTAIALYDKNGDGTVDFRDFMNEKAIQQYGIGAGLDDNSDGIIDTEELKSVMEKLNGPGGLTFVTNLMNYNSEFKSNIETMAKENLSKAILDVSNSSFNEDVTKNLLADFMTNRQKQMFQGDMVEVDGVKVPKYTQIIPDKGNVTFETVTGNDRKKTGLLKIDGHEIHSIDDLIEQGGNYGYLQENGYTYNDHEDNWIFNSAFSGGTHITKIDLNK